MRVSETGIDSRVCCLQGINQLCSDNLKYLLGSYVEPLVETQGMSQEGDPVGQERRFISGSDLVVTKEAKRDQQENTCTEVAADAGNHWEGFQRTI